METTLRVGTIIVRPVEVMADGRREVLDTKFGRGERDKRDRVFIALPPSAHGLRTDRWVVKREGMTGRGIVCFAQKQGDVPPGWTHFIVEVMSKGGNTATVRLLTKGREWLFGQYKMPEYEPPMKPLFFKKDEPPEEEEDLISGLSQLD